MIDRKRFYDAVRPLFSGHFTQAQVNGIESILAGWVPEDGTIPDRSRVAGALAAAFIATGTAMQPADGDLAAFARRYGPDGDGAPEPIAGLRLRGRRAAAAPDDVTTFLTAVDEATARFLLGLRWPA